MQSDISSSALRVLFIEDNEAEVHRLREQLVSLGYSVLARRVDGESALREALLGDTWDLLIASFEVPDCSVMTALALLQQSNRDIPLIAVSADLDEAAACQAMQAGAQDCLDHLHLGRLAAVIERERREARMRQERRAALDAMRVNDARFQALAANVPGMLFQMQVNAEGSPQFLYVSEASQMLLGMRAEEFLSRDNALIGLIVPEDREGFFADLRLATDRQSTLNWEGRVMPPGSEAKWVNLRCSARTPGNGQLIWEGVMWNITQSKQTEVELRSSQAQLAALSNHLQTVKEEERDRIARDIHDVLGSTLVGMKFSVAILAGKLEADSPLRARVKQVEDMIDDAITTAGRVARELRPGILKEFGLAAAIESHAEDFKQRTGVSCEVLCADHDIETSENAAIALFRTYQEALTNITKHARATQVEVRLMQEGDEIVLEVSDNGRGIESADLRKPKSFGLRGIRERLNALGGTMDILAREPNGTTVVLRAPLLNEMGRENVAFPGGQA